MTREEREQALEWFKNRPITMSGAKKMYDLAIAALEQLEPCEDAVSRAEVLRMIDCINDHHAITPYKSAGAVTEHLTRIARSLPPVTPKQPDCAKCKSELANKIRGQQDNPGMLTENDKGRNWGLEWAAQIVEGKRR